jgi:Protein of unknown function (DUF4019)
MKQKWGSTVCAVALTVIFTCGISYAEQTQGVARAARSWLSLVDAEKYGESWNDVAQYLKKRITKTQWVTQLQQARMPLGTVKSRKFAGTQFKNALPGLPAGQYAAVRYTTAFEKAPASTEVVVMIFEQGQWHVMAYLPQARIVGQSK